MVLRSCGASVAGLSDLGTYTDWSVAAIRRLRGRADAVALFDSSIAEPTRLLSGLLEGGLEGPLGSSFVSVFGSGNPLLIQALAARYRLSPDMLLTTTGAINGLELLLDVLVAPGQTVLVERPCFDVLPILAAKAGADIRFVERAYPGYDLDLGELEQGFAEGARLLLLTNLHNPSGHLLPDARLRQIADLAARYQATVIIDEVYRGFADTHACAATLAPNIVTVNSLTKIYGLFGLKCGWIAGNPALVEQVRRHHAHRDPGVAKLTHAVAALILQNSGDFDAHWQAILARTRPVLLSHVEAMRADGLMEGDVPPEGCIYFPRLAAPLSGTRLVERLWQAEAVLAVPGALFGDERHLRIGFGADPVALARGLMRLHMVLRQERS